MKAILNELWDRMRRAADLAALHSHALVDAAAAVPSLDEIEALRRLEDEIVFGK